MKQKCIAIRQPFAYLVIRPDITDPVERQNALDNGFFKLIENRSQNSHYRGDLLIHASLTYDPDDFVYCFELAHKLGFEMSENEDHYQFGGIIGRVTMTGVTKKSKSPFYVPNNFGYEFDNPVVLPYTKIRGYTQIFSVDVDL